MKSGRLRFVGNVLFIPIQNKPLSLCHYAHAFSRIFYSSTPSNCKGQPTQTWARQYVEQVAERESEHVWRVYVFMNARSGEGGEEKNLRRYNN